MPPPNRKLEVLALLPDPSIAKKTKRGKVGTSGWLSGLMGIAEQNVCRYLRMLYADGLAHIGCWNRTTGPFAPVWVQGKGEHAPQPRKMTDVERARRKNAKVKKAIERARKGFQYDERYAGRVALALANEVAARTRINPQHWFSPLGL